MHQWYEYVSPTRQPNYQLLGLAYQVRNSPAPPRGGLFHRGPPWSLPSASRSEMRTCLSLGPEKDSSRSPLFSISPRNSPNGLVTARMTLPRRFDSITGTSRP